MLLQKDPYAPKRPKSGYLHYLEAFRAKHPELGHKEIVSKGAEEWSSLSDEAKVPYNALYEAAKVEYNAKLQAMVSKVCPTLMPSHNKLLFHQCCYGMISLKHALYVT